MEGVGINPYYSEQNISTLKLADRTMYNPQTGYFYYLFPGFWAFSSSNLSERSDAGTVLNEKDRLKHLPLDRASRRIRAGEIVPQIFRIAGLSFIGSLPSMLVAHWFFAYPLEGSLILILSLQVIFLACLTGMAFILAAIFDDETHCTEFVMFMAIPTMLSCGYGWPEFMMAPGFASVVKVIWPLYYYNNPLKELLLKGAELSAIGHYAAGGLLLRLFGYRRDCGSTDKKSGQ
jgi:ABC-2 type transport system permease protein